MKRVLLFIIVSLNVAICFSSCEKNSTSSKVPNLPMSLEDAIEFTKNIWDKYDIVTAWTDIVPANTQLKVLLDITGKDFVISPNYDAWIIFADTNPLANGGPHYKWIFVGVNNGKVVTLETTSEPFAYEYSDAPVEEFLKHRLEIKRVRLYPSTTKSQRLAPPQSITSSYQTSYSLSDLPTGATTTWSISVEQDNYSIGSGIPLSTSNTYSSLPFTKAILKATSTYSGATYLSSKNIKLGVLEFILILI